MKKILKAVISSSIFLGLIFPNSAVFASAETLTSKSAVPVQGPKIAIRMAGSESGKKITIAHESQASASTLATCAGAIGEGGSVNLNRPADCFYLRVGSLASAPEIHMASLTVIDQQLVVINNRNTLSSPSLAQGAVPVSVPVIPLTPYALAAVFMAFASRRLGRSSNIIKQIKANIIPHQLVELRC